MCYKYPEFMEAVLLHVVGLGRAIVIRGERGARTVFPHPCGGGAICYDLASARADAVDRVCERALMEASVYDDSRRTDIERDVERWRRNLGCCQCHLRPL